MVSCDVTDVVPQGPVYHRSCVPTIHISVAEHLVAYLQGLRYCHNTLEVTLLAANGALQKNVTVTTNKRTHARMPPPTTSACTVYAETPSWRFRLLLTRLQ